MRMRLVIPAVVFALSLGFAPSAWAAPPTQATGTLGPVAGSITFTGVRTADGNTFIDFTAIEAFTGGFAGTGDDVGTVVFYASGGVTVQAVEMFAGTVNGVPGTLVLRGEGAGVPSAVQGHLVILSGTGDLANLRGQGTFVAIVGVGGPYSMQIHF